MEESETDFRLLFQMHRRPSHEWIYLTFCDFADQRMCFELFLKESF